MKNMLQRLAFGLIILIVEIILLCKKENASEETLPRPELVPQS